MRRKRPICQHCKKRPGCRPRQLCYTCHANFAIRKLYPSKSKFGKRGNGGENTSNKEPLLPTYHYPGTQGKIAEMSLRSSLGEGLFHASDAKRPHAHATHHAELPRFSDVVDCTDFD